MGKLQSKHVFGTNSREGPEGQCILVGTPATTSSERSTSIKWRNITFDQKSELSMSLASAVLSSDDQIPLTVVLPPLTNEDEKIDKVEDNMKPDIEKTENNNNEKLNVEEFECGVSIAGSDKQEWAFTLYDFDGRGKITKEDLGGLLKSLYDAVAISLPQRGTKTLKLRLTVSPDKTAKVHPQKDVISKIPEKSQNNQIKAQEQSKLNKDRNNSKLTRHNVKQNNLNLCTKFESAHQANLTTENVENIASVPNNQKEVKNTNVSHGGKPGMKTRVTERKHLADLVQQNMERHHQQQLRRYPSDPPKRIRSRRSQRDGQAECQESQERRNYYLDLAGVDSEQISRLHNNTAPAAVLGGASSPVREGATVTGSPFREHRHRPRSHSEHHSRGYERKPQNSPALSGLPEERVRNIEKTIEDEIAECEIVTPVISPEQLDEIPVASPTKAAKSRPISLPMHLPETVSPHHHWRHRHRERNRKRAMMQVAEWIEREHAWTTPVVPQAVVQRHEHHHIHEHHHHHHYHHYQQT